MFYDKVTEIAPSLHKSLPGLPEASIPELTAYFCESWGNRTRIDYGSGMELNFLCWMICLERLGVVQESDHVALVVRVFWRYVEVMRVLQSTYWLEPAGHKYIRPKSIHDMDTVDEYSKYYMYLACIKFIESVKTASLRWHSPMLDDISAVKTWEKVNSGMMKMYLAEVLGKLPVMQHFLFGSILPWEGPILLPPISTAEEDAHWGHAHTMGDRGGVGQRENGWGDCCGIPVPSIFAAAQEEGKIPGARLAGPGIRPIPFD
ncbi:Serine/threonine-protein phosphatase 2A activator 2 [Grifola frondosa]|uniref:Serine/threonine-protein phosphatase 2A activator n=1 Tax=Grifola frondosa TaxID=5627 RepID=A0A1C7MGY1_GRIFR|nr:Serine/threonine-protein phosphatase 2A activator 2 [Grifola frondosa]